MMIRIALWAMLVCALTRLGIAITRKGYVYTNVGRVALIF